MDGRPPRSTHRGYVAKDIMQRFFPDSALRPEGLLTAIFVALGEAERRGFEDCMSIFEKPQGANENQPTGTNPHQ